jgi:hypothetical protein
MKYQLQTTPTNLGNYFLSLYKLQYGIDIALYIHLRAACRINIMISEKLHYLFRIVSKKGEVVVVSPCCSFLILHLSIVFLPSFSKPIGQK